MAIDWGGWTAPSGYRFRVGIEFSVTDLTVAVRFFEEVTGAVTDAQTITWSGAIAGTWNYTLSHGAGGGVTEVASTSLTATPGTTYTVTAVVTGVHNGHSPTVTAQFTLPGGAALSDGTAWKAGQFFLSDGTTWKALQPSLSDGTTWKTTT